MATTQDNPTPTQFAMDNMAPNQRWAVRFEQRTNKFSERYDDDGNLSALGDRFDGMALKSNLFPALRPFGTMATLGTAQFKHTADIEASVLTLGYGLTPDLTLGLILPYISASSHVNFSVNGGNIGFNPAFNTSQPIGAGNFPLAPVGGAIVPMGTSGVQTLLTNPVFGYQYRPIKSTHYEGLSDPTLGILWRAIKSRGESMTIRLGLRKGIAKKDDPDNLIDTPLGDGSDDIRTRIEYFRDLNDYLDMRLMADYTWQTADHRTLRIPNPGQVLALSTSKERLKRDLGDFMETDVEMGYRKENWRFAAAWHHYEKKSDAYHSSLATSTSELETNTYSNAEQYRLSAIWSGLHAWRQNKLPLPIILKLEIQETFAGRNVYDSRDINFQITTLFR